MVRAARSLRAVTARKSWLSCLVGNIRSYGWLMRMEFAETGYFALDMLCKAGSG